MYKKLFLLIVKIYLVNLWIIFLHGYAQIKLANTL